MSDDDSHLYSVDIQTWASPDEVKEFCDLLERNGYGVVTDLAHGKLRVREGDADE